VQHNFKSEIFKEVRGIISRNAMNMVLKETQLAHKIGVGKITCGCVIRSTHGLPCAHKIASSRLKDDQFFYQLCILIGESYI